MNIRAISDLLKHTLHEYVCSFFLIVMLLLPSPLLANEVSANTPEALFVRRILPLLNEKCLACHGNDASDIQGGLDLRSRESILKGGDQETPGLVDGKPLESPIYLAVLRTHDDWQPMPPKEADQLTPEQIGWLESWIAGGAPWPADDVIKSIQSSNAEKWSAEDGLPVKTSGGLSPEWTDRRYKPEGLWAYKPVVAPEIPGIDANAFPHRAIDSLIAAKLPEGLAVAPAADRLTLIRRASFDLTGLPPTPEEIEQFLADPLPDRDAFAKVVDRLLDSPHYGERMAQHWLDVARYADSSGFANDYERGNAWRYRDYVIRSFNADKPYEQFIREQIAGDEIDASNPEMLIATGFLRMGPWELTSMEVAKVARQRFLDDVVNSVGETFLAHSLQCAKCHDHKFDPIPTRDYYSMHAVFATTQLVEHQAPFLEEENLSGFEEKEYIELRRAEYIRVLKEIDQKSVESSLQWFIENDRDPTSWRDALEQARSLAGAGKQTDTNGVFNRARDILRKKGIPEDQFPPKAYAFTPSDYGNERVARKGLERLNWEQDRYQPYAFAVYSGRTPSVTSVNAPIRKPSDFMTVGELEQTCILTGGDAFANGEAVSPAALSVLDSELNVAIPDSIEGRRKAFAEWVASERNPLTTRSIVNRIWMWHFNQPIAGNPNNFGSTGKLPTHPELLDWLAATFVESGWSFKSLHRFIMASEAYQRSTHHPDRKQLAELDPTETSYAVFKPRRLSAEELRDAMLTATGELNRTLGGIPNRPEINLEAALQPRQVMGTFAAAWVPNPLPEQRHRRSIYALKIRGLPDPQMEVFNQPTPDFSCERREASTVTPQVFSLFNGQTTHARALALAHRVMQATNDEAEAIKRCYLLTFGRPPTERESQACIAHWKEIETMIDDEVASDESVPLSVRREAVEENTGEKFAFQETLYAYADFVPDLQPADVPLRTRALADVCLVIFNLNEFSYLY